MSKPAICIAKENSISHDGSIIRFDEFKEAIDNCPNLVLMDGELWLIQDVSNKSISHILADILISRPE